MRKSQVLFLNDQSTIRTESFLDLCRNSPNVLIRRRKMPTEDLIYSMINRKGLTLVNTDQTEHTARRFSAWLPPIQCTLSGHQCMLIIQV